MKRSHPPRRACSRDRRPRSRAARVPRLRQLRQGLLSATALLATAVSQADTRLAITPEEPLQPYPAAGSYVVLIAQSDYAVAGWREAAEALRKKHDADLVILPDGSLDPALPALRRLRPRYACLVSSPERAGRGTVVALHRLLRRVDNDPYTDVLWGILTGYEPADAVRIAKRTEPLVIETAASSMGPGSFKHLKGGFASAETQPTDFWRKVDGGETVHETVAPDAAGALAKAFNTIPPDVFVTSGHATEHDWQIGYNVRGGQFRHENGQLFALNTANKRFDIRSPHPKVYLPIGNCLIGHVSGRDCMATAWMHTGGVYQMFGYTAVTFHGYMGWGVGSYFGDGRLTLAQAWHLNQQSLLRLIETKHPGQAGVELESYDQRTVNLMARLHGLTRETLGPLWDRDIVPFYGDPAWAARHRPNPAWSCRLEEEPEGRFTFSLETLRDGAWGNRPVGILLPDRLEAIADVACETIASVLVADDFLLLPLEGTFTKGEQHVVTFGARRAAASPTSAGHEPIDTTRLDPETAACLETYPKACRAEIGARLIATGENRPELVEALRKTPADQREAMGFLLAHMPERDARNLTAAFLLENVALAVEAWRAAPWHERVPQELFLNDILPYASLNERRDNWRADFRRKCLPVVAGIEAPGAAAIALNTNLYDLVGVTYHATRRPKPDQSPYESIEAGFASCTGLSILLVDACRAVGIPARIAGVPRWTDGQGNHTWVEVWDGAWHVIGASESRALDDAWFREGAAKADPSSPVTRIYASSFAPTGTVFPLAWAPLVRYVHAMDVTADYKARWGGPEAPTEEPPPARDAP